MLTNVDKFEEFHRNLREKAEMEDLINLSTDTRAETKPKEKTETRIMMEMMLQENRRRDEMFERMIARLAVPQQPQTPPSGNNTIHIMPDLSRNINLFDGEKGSTRAHEWITEIESMQRLHNWSDSFTMETTRSHLRGGAMQWYKNRIREIDTWQKFQAAFRKTFVGVESLPLKWKRMTERVQNRGESIQSYFHAKLKLCSDVGCNFKDAKEQILVGLLSDKLCDTVSTMPHTNADELLHDLTYQECLYEQRKGRLRYRDSTLITDKKMIERRPETKSSETNTKKFLPSRDLEGKPLCFACKKYGHVSKYCRNRDSNSRSDTAKEKQENAQVGQEQKPPDNNQMVVEQKQQEETGGKYMKEMLINGDIKIEGFVDPGSAVCTITEKFVNRNKLKCQPGKQKLYGFGKSVPIETYWHTKIKLSVDDVQKEVEAIVVPDDVQFTDILVGRSFTELPDIAYIRMGNKLHFGYRDENPFQNIDLEDIQTKPEVRATQPVMLLGNQINFIHMQHGEERQILTVWNDAVESIEFKEGETIGEIRGSSRDENTYSELSVHKPITMDMLNVDNSIDMVQRQELLKLINEFRECFAISIHELGCTDLLTVDIEDNEVPVRAKPYRTSFRDRQIIKDIISEWRSCGIIRETNSSYASPVL